MWPRGTIGPRCSSAKPGSDVSTGKMHTPLSRHIGWERGDFMQHCPTCPDAVAHIKGSHHAPSLSGEVRFYQCRESVLVVAEVSGLPHSSETGFFALHIHEGEHCSGTQFADTGGHYNPTNAPHPNHAGDLPPLLLCRGGAFLAIQTDRFCLRDVIGRTVVIHSSSDDFKSQPAGQAGEKLACGVICPCKTLH